VGKYATSELISTNNWDSAEREVESAEDSASIAVDSPDEDVVSVVTGDAADNAGDGGRSNFNGEGETGSCLITGDGVDGLWTTGHEGSSGDDGDVGMLHEMAFGFLAAAAAVRAVFAVAVCCFALFNTLRSTVNWIACAAGLMWR
jgi:hypothetical protein